MVSMAPTLGEALNKREHDQCYQTCGEAVVVKVVAAAMELTSPILPSSLHEIIVPDSSMIPIVLSMAFFIWEISLFIRSVQLSLSVC